MKKVILAQFDEIIEQITQYLGKFDDHIKAMDADRAKVFEAKGKAEGKLREVKEMREYIAKKLK